MDESTGPYKWPTWCKKKKKNPSFLSKHQECTFLFSFRRLKQSPLPPPKRHYSLTTPPHPTPTSLCLKPFSPQELDFGSLVRGLVTPGLQIDKSAICRHRMGFWGTLYITASLSKRPYKRKGFDFVLSKGSLNLCSLLHANDMRWDLRNYF